MLKRFSLRFAVVACTALLGLNAIAQLPKLTKPKVTMPTVTTGGSKSTSASDVGIGKKDPSGLFSNCTDDESADYHRKSVVANLATMEAEFKKTTIDYEALTKLVFENERSLGSILKLEPKVDRSKYDEKYLPLKARADKQNTAYAEAQKLESLFSKEFSANPEMISPDPISFRTESYGGHSQCYCRNYRSETKTLAEFEAAKKQYEEYVSQMVGYSDAETQKRFANMTTCLANGNKYAVWAAKENLEKAVVAYNTEKKAANPKTVIARCEEYLAGLERIETDNSLRLDAAAKAALTEGKATTSKIKADAETYLTGGGYEKYLATEHAAAIAKVFMPKAGGKDATLEAGALAYVKGAEYGEYIASSDIKVASTVRVVTVSADYRVHKNDYGLPLYQYKEFAVAFKGADGKCYIASVYANYTYKGGGTYATVPDWGANRPDEMACANVSK
jgi:hypothetical protein